MRTIALLLLALLIGAGISVAAEPSTTPAPPQAVDASSVEVWITKTGKRYHRATCRYAKIKSNLKVATAQGLTPCLVCNP